MKLQFVLYHKVISITIMIKIISIVLILNGCKSIPYSIKGSNQILQKNLVQIVETPEIYIGKEVRFGGKVLKVINQKRKTRLEMTIFPLDSIGKPIFEEDSIGRVYADVNRFLDPIDYLDKTVTVVGIITDTVQGKIGDRPYRFIIIQATGYKRWSIQKKVTCFPNSYDFCSLYPHFCYYDYNRSKIYN